MLYLIRIHTIMRFKTKLIRFSAILFFLIGTAQAQQNYSSQGKEFWISVMNAGNNISPLTVYITSDVNTCGKIEIPLGTYTQTFNVTANAITSIVLPWGAAYLQNTELDQIINKGVHIITDDSVLVYLSNESAVAYDTEMIYPVSTIGTSYIANCYKEGTSFSQFSIAATQNNTSIQITPSAIVLGPGPAFAASRPSGIAYNLTMNAGQVYLAVSQGDLTGSIITSDKPISVFGGAAISPVGGCNAGDHLCEQILPQSLYGTHYITAPLSSRTGGDLFRFTAYQNGTSFSINGGPAINLNANQYKDTLLTLASEITSNKKISVGQFSRGQNCDNQQGDPFFILIHPISEMNTYSLFNMLNPFSQFPKRFVNIITTTANTANILLNGAGIGASFAPVAANPAYSYAQVAIPVGINRIACPQGFVANAYAFGNYISYGNAVGHVKNTFNPIQKASCSGSGVTLTASSGSNYVWSPAGGLNCNTCQTVIANPTTSTTYTVSFTSATGCSDVLIYQIDLDTAYNASITPVNTVCLSDPAFSFIAVDTGGVWSGTGITNTSNGTFNPAVAGVGTHTIIYSIPGLCGDADTTTISVIQLANAAINPAGPFCITDAPINLNAATSGGTWQGNGITNTITGIFSPTVAGIGTHTISYSISGSCGDTGTVVVTVNPSPIVTVTSNGDICLGDSITLSATGGGTYLWSNGSTDSTIVISPATIGAFSYSVQVANTNCLTNDSVIVNVLQPPTANAGPDDTICLGQAINIIGTGGTSYLWNTGDTTNLITVSPTTDSTFMLITYSGICSDTDLVNIFVKPYPVANAGADINIYSGDVVTLNATGGGSYSWSPANGLSCTNCASPLASPNETTTYVLTVTDAYGCTDTDTLTIYVETNCGHIYVPTAFSPNTDGENDIFYVYAKCVKNITVEIYDRWGKKVAEINNITQGWDGTYEGNLFNTAVFVYTLHVEFSNGEELNKKGNISLVR